MYAHNIIQHIGRICARWIVAGRCGGEVRYGAWDGDDISPEIEKPRRRGYDVGMEFSDYLLWKALVVVVGAFLYGLFVGTNPRSKEEGRDKPLE